ncbi:hypothetical protein GH733_008094 [Mirounga leonina]|nr:hypothetical protein GH733_008094 [Mirounga leonina]
MAKWDAWGQKMNDMYFRHEFTHHQRAPMTLTVPKIRRISQATSLGFCHLKGTVCDCGRYRKVVGQLDISVARLKTSMKFVKNVIAGIRETEEKFYYIVQEEKNYRESLTHCRIRGGMLAMPKDEAANTLIADYVAKSGFFRVFIGVNDLEKEGQYVFTDNTPLQNYSNWKEGEPSDPYGHEDCVEMLSSGRWNDTECHLTMYFVCEFVKKKK